MLLIPNWSSSSCGSQIYLTLVDFRRVQEVFPTADVEDTGPLNSSDRIDNVRNTLYRCDIRASMEFQSDTTYWMLDTSSNPGVVWKKATITEKMHVTAAYITGIARKNAIHVTPIQIMSECR